MDRGDQGIATKGRREPGDARHREEAAVEFFEEDPQVHLAAPEQTAVEEGVVGADSRGVVMPAPVGRLQGLQRVVVEIAEHRLVFAHQRDDVDHQADGLLAGQRKVPGQRAIVVDGAGRAVDDHLGASDDAVLAVVGEGDAAAADLGCSQGAHRLPLVAADIEHVTEVRLDPQRALDLDRFAAAILESDPLMQAAVDEATATNAQALLWNAALALVEEKDRVDHLKGRDVTLID